MHAYLVRAPPSEVTSFLATFTESPSEGPTEHDGEGGSFVGLSEQESQSDIRMTGGASSGIRIPGFPQVSAAFALREPAGGSTLLAARLRLSGGTATGLIFLRVVIIFILFVLAMKMPSIGDLYQDYQRPLTLGAILATSLLLIGWAAFAGAEGTLLSCETALRDALSAEFPVEPLTPRGTTIDPPSLNLLYTTAALVAGIVALFNLGATLLALFVITLAGRFVAERGLETIAGRNYGALWKVKMIYMAEAWISLLSVILIVAALLYILNVMDYVFFQTNPLPGPDTHQVKMEQLEEALSPVLLMPALRQSGEATPEGANLLRALGWATWVETRAMNQSERTDPRVVEERIRSRLRFFASGILLILGVGWYFIGLTVFLAMKTAREWVSDGFRVQRSLPFLLEIQPVPILPLAAGFVWHFLIAAAVTIPSFVLAVDGVAYLMFGRPAFIDQTVLVLSWLLVPGLAFETEVLRVLGMATIAVLALPAMLLIAVWMRRLTRGSIGALSTVFRSSPPEALVAVVRECANRAGLKRVKAHVVRSRFIRAAPRPRLVGTPVVEVSRPAIEVLTERELQAVVAHEVWHLRRGSRRLLLLRWLSTLGLFPSFYLTAIFDYGREEADADDFAASCVGDRQLVAEAIAKVGAHNTSVQLAQRRRMGSLLQKMSRPLAPAKTLLQLLFGDALQGYSHIVLADRIGRLQR